MSLWVPPLNTVPFYNQPQYPVELNMECPLINNGGEFFNCSTVKIKNNINNVPVTQVGGGIVLTRTLNKNIFALQTQSDGCSLSGTIVTPPIDLTLFSVAIPIVTWDWWPMHNTVCGFTKTDIDAQSCGGNACMELLSFLNNFGAKVVGVNLTYSDATTEYEELAIGTLSNTNPWFIAASYKDATSLTLVARDLITGEFAQSVVSKTKTLKSSAQKLSIGGVAPYGTASWTRSYSNVIAYTGWIPKFLSVNILYNMAMNPWQVFKQI